MSELGLATAIGHLRREIGEAMSQARGEALQFTLGPVELELEVELTAGGEGGVEAKWVVVSIGGKVHGERRSSHRVKLTLTPQVAGRADVKVSDQLEQLG